MPERFIVKPKSADVKEKKYIYISLRIERGIQETYDALSAKSGYSRNKLMRMALCYALEHLEFAEEEK